MIKITHPALPVMTVAVRAAGRVCRLIQADLVNTAAVEKGDKSPVTVADFAAQAIVSRILERALPNVPLVGEEDAALLREPENEAVRDQVVKNVLGEWTDADSTAVLAAIDRGAAACDGTGTYFVLDPIDGTKGFLRGEQYAVALALIEEGEVVLGALCGPNLDGPNGAKGAVFLAARGQGSVMLPLDESAGDAVPIRVSDIADPARTRFCMSAEKAHSHKGWTDHVADKLGVTADPVRIDSQCKYGLVARGDAELYLRLPTRKDYQEKIWDHAAGMIVVTESGGRVTDIDGKPLDFTHGRTLRENRGVVCSNGKLHDAVIAAIAATEH
jgi:3'(2'), 5'-bisphosphate nucleotidase